MEFASPQVVQRGNQLDVSHGTDENLLVEFVTHAEEQGYESEKKGRPIFKDVTYIRILFPGDKNREVFRRADLQGKNGRTPDNVRFPRAWAAFERKEEVVHEGTPLEEWPPISKSLALTYKGRNCHTVEHLAAVPDSWITEMGPGAADLRAKAKTWLEAAEGNAELLSLRKKNEDLENDVKALQTQIAELSAKLDDGKKPATNRSKRR